jgi:hypothetical protein
MAAKIWQDCISIAVRLAKEPPFRVIAKGLVAALPLSVRIKAEWDAAARPQYLTGLLRAADEALAENVSSIAAIEFGVAGGQGLLALQKYAAGVEREMEVQIAVYGFDTGRGLPQFCGDYRDHPDQWKHGDYPMDEKSLRDHLDLRTTLLIGNIAETLDTFSRIASNNRIGFIAVDVDLYSSTREALKILADPKIQKLRQVPIYFDDIDLHFNHSFAGELLAIREFNSNNAMVKIDKWRGIANERPFPEHSWLKKMYMAHDLAAINGSRVDRKAAQLSL